MIVNRQGFFLLDLDEKTGLLARKHATSLGVLEALGRAAQSCPPGELGTAALRHTATLAQLEQALRTGEVDEAEAARKLCMTVGPPIELALAAAVANGSAALKRARRDTRAAPSVWRDASRTAAEEDGEGGASQQLGRRASGGGSGSSSHQTAAPPDPAPSALPARRSSRKLGEPSQSSGLTPALHSVALSFSEADEDDLDADIADRNGLEADDVDIRVYTRLSAVPEVRDSGWERYGLPAGPMRSSSVSYRESHRDSLRDSHRGSTLQQEIAPIPEDRASLTSHGQPPKLPERRMSARTAQKAVDAATAEFLQSDAAIRARNLLARVVVRDELASAVQKKWRDRRNA